jgi:FMN-dependent NADH-azoreductase
LSLNWTAGGTGGPFCPASTLARGVRSVEFFSTAVPEYSISLARLSRQTGLSEAAQTGRSAQRDHAMTTLLHIDASPRGERSLSRKLSKAFVEAWVGRRPDTAVIIRDIGRTPPSLTTESWIGAVFSAADQLTPAQREETRLSDELIDELDRADLIVIGAPMHNYGMPAALKAWFDNVIRIGKTFTFDLARGDYPLQPIMSGKTLVILSSRGEFGFGPGGVREGMNHLETHIRTCAHYLGVEDSHLIAIDYQEFNDERHQRSVADAYAAIPVLVDQLAGAVGLGRIAAE